MHFLSFGLFAIGVFALVWLFLVISTLASSASRFMSFVRREYPDYAGRSNAMMLVRLVAKPDPVLLNHPVYGRLARTRPYLEMRMLLRELLKVTAIVIAAFAVGMIVRAIG